MLTLTPLENVLINKTVATISSMKLLNSLCEANYLTREFSKKKLIKIDYPRKKINFFPHTSNPGYFVARKLMKRLSYLEYLQNSGFLSILNSHISPIHHQERPHKEVLSKKIIRIKNTNETFKRPICEATKIFRVKSNIRRISSNPRMRIQPSMVNNDKSLKNEFHRTIKSSDGKEICKRNSWKPQKMFKIRFSSPFTQVIIDIFVENM